MSRLPRRQWGAETRREPLSIVHDRPSDGKIARSRIAVVLTVVLWAAYVVTTILRQFLDNGTQSFRFTMEAVAYLAIVTLLCLSAWMYLVARAGALQRFKHHERVPRAELERHFSENPADITVLVPSYAEEPGVVRATLLSAALQEFPGKRVVLLLDDSPTATGLDGERRDLTIALVDGIRTLLAEPAAYARTALDAFAERRNETRLRGGDAVPAEELHDAARAYSWAAAWLRGMAATESVDDHVDQFFVEQVLGKLAEELEVTSAALVAAALSDEGAVPVSRVAELYRRLVWTFSAEVDVFQRKAWSSLSHEANKAMNLNSYLGLMGRSFRIEETPEGRALVPASPDEAELSFPDTEFVLTLDADSLLLREYCLRLVHFMRQPGNERVAVTQTPYSSFRGAGTRIERLAGATTDVQHVLHQGMTYHGATFWVGANAVIRKSALNDILETEYVGGFEVRRYIQDRTVIEDTESSIDIAAHGWTLVNYPERLSYSATPPDFGSLVVQRRRWANGGLLIMPKLFAQARERRRTPLRMRPTEFMLRLNYTGSIAWSSFALLFLLGYPFDGKLLSPLVVAAALPYFLSMASDLRYNGYKRLDVVRIYGFNLIMLPVNLAGVLKSMQQAVTAKKIPFARTPKVKDRTATPLLYLLAPLVIILFSLFTLWRAWVLGNWGNAAFAALNAALSIWAMLSLIGVGPFLVDAWMGATGWLYVAERPKATRVADDSAPDWRTVLYRGAGDSAHAVGDRPHTELPAARPSEQAPESSAARPAEQVV
ncbi:MAG: glycosyltransferase family 2 protein [Microbacteriaceae bacterium]|nr:glycosyltransferase family 2 protein [Microbacteriaceae bacterium]MCL2793930.1 glycosyltransferase family 2 protein [Microbacteriaceae bacterium]